MEKLHLSININAPTEKVWFTMLYDATYRIWAEVFYKGSYFEGNWDQGSEMKFLAKDEQGNLGGMLGKIKENKLFESISIEYIANIVNGVEDTTSDMAKLILGAHENYTFKNNNDGTTELSIDMDLNAEMKAMLEPMWKTALQKLKELAETKPDNVTIEATIDAPMQLVWETWTKPEHIVNWAFASDDWEALSAENDLRKNGKFTTVMAAKDKSFQFPFGGVYTNVKENELIEYILGDGRYAKITFTQTPEGVKVSENFEIEGSNPKEMQKAGWQAIMDNFKKYTLSKK